MTMGINALSAAALAATICALALWLMLRYAARRLPLDVPNQRSLHERPVPRIGGIAIIAGVAAAVGAGLVPFGLALAAALALGVFSFADDVHPLPTLVRFAPHLAAAAGPLWFPLLVFAPFIGDATVTLIRRLVRGERVWQAHREHYYQRMVRMGLGHAGTAIVAYAAMLLCALSALFGRNEPPALQAAVFFGMTALLAGLAVWVDVRWARHRRGTAAS